MLKCIAIDDSKVQLKIVEHLIILHPNLEFCGTFLNALEAKQMMKNKKIDLIFLDIEMPLISGIDFMKTFEVVPKIIIISSKEKYAFEAFKYNVIDYLKKPVNKEIFYSSVDRAIRKSENEKLRLQSDKFEQGECIYVKSNLQNIKIPMNSIIYIEAKGDYMNIVTTNKKHLVLCTLKEILKNLPEHKFMRVHKSYVVNLAKVKKFNSKYITTVQKEIPLSRNKKSELFKRLKK